MEEIFIYLVRKSRTGGPRRTPGNSSGNETEGFMKATSRACEAENWQAVLPCQKRAFRGSLETRETTYGKRQNKGISVCSYFLGFVCVSDMIEWSVGFCIGSGNKDKRGKTS